jgi:hypothetical protein
MAKIEEWVERSDGKVRADVAFDKLVAPGFDGSHRTVRRAVAEVKANHRRERRVYRSCIPEPGMWAQCDWGTGPSIGGRAVLLFCPWLAWSRFRVLIPTWDRTMPTLIGCQRRRVVRRAGFDEPLAPPWTGAWRTSLATVAKMSFR